MEQEIEIRRVTEYPRQRYRQLVERNLNANGIVIESEAKRSGKAQPSQDHERVRIGAYDGDELVGLSWGGPIGPRRFMMHISLIDEAYRGRGLYTRLLERMLDETKEFDQIDSTHHIFNNHIIAIKLRHGFHIVGMDQSIIVGPRVLMRHYRNPDELELMRFRVGLRGDPRDA